MLKPTTSYYLIQISVVFGFVFLLSSCGEVQNNKPNNKDQINRPFTPSVYMPRVSTVGAENSTKILVKFKSNVGSASRSRALSDAGLTPTASYSLVPGLTLAEPLAGLTVKQTLESLVNDPQVAYAEPDYLLTTNMTPDDPQYSGQYGLRNSGQSGGLINADINIESAWDIQTGTNVIVAVIDSGVDYNHVDLVDNMWVNLSEIPGNNIDDDNNGYVDDVKGWNFRANNNDPMDDNDHGTHVAGIIGAKSNNGVGVAGINWNVQIMPLKFMNANGQGRTSAAINALEYAIANGAKISNNSWGGGSFSQALFDAIQAANSAGHLFIAAAGNEGANNDQVLYYPSSYDLSNIISVGASDDFDQAAGYSNFGRQTVDLFAPGTSILSTVRNNAYRQRSGTSMAAPFVSGVAALMAAERSDLNGFELKNAILNNVDIVNGLSESVSGGRLNAFAALTGAIATSPAAALPIGSADPGTVITPDPNSGPNLDPNLGANPGATPGITAITIVPNVIDVAIGASAQLTATGGVAPYTWSVDSPAYATIDPDTGVFTGLTVGTVLVSVVDSTGALSPGYQINLINMQVLPVKITQILLSETVTLSANGGVAPYDWSVSDPTVVDVAIIGADSNELILSPLKPGSFEVTLKDSSQNSAKTGTIVVVVEPLVLLPETSVLKIDESLQLSVSGGTSPYLWASDKPDVVRVDGSGVVTGVSVGSAIITVTDYQDQTQSVVVTVGATISIDSPGSLFSVNETKQFIATGGDGVYRWSSSNDTIATVSTNGLVSGVAPGFVTITVADGLGQSVDQVIEVRQIQVTSPFTSVIVGDPAFSLNVIGTTGAITWTVSNAAIGNIDPNGLFVPVATGTVTVTATDADGFSGFIDITITSAAATTPPATTFGGHH